MPRVSAATLVRNARTSCVNLLSTVTNYWLHSVYTVFSLLPFLIIELMHVPITVLPTLYITVLHTCISHIIINDDDDYYYYSRFSIDD